jgi:Zn-dependent protease
MSAARDEYSGRVTQYDPYAPREAAEPAEAEYSPLKHPLTIREILRKLFAPIIALGLFLLKFGVFALKFFGIFISVAGYALIWGWRFAAGFVLLIAVHELGHYIEATRQGLKPQLPVFIPFLGAYVAIKNAPFDPWRNLLVSAAGPILGSIGALGVWVAGEATDSRFLIALAYTGFLLNLFNLIPVRPFDGGFMWRSLKALRYGNREHAPWASSGRLAAGSLIYTGLVVLLILAMVATHVEQNRL